MTTGPTNYQLILVITAACTVIVGSVLIFLWGLSL